MIRPMRSAILAATLCLSLGLDSPAQTPAAQTPAASPESAPPAAPAAAPAATPAAAPAATPAAAPKPTAQSAWPDTIQVQRPGKPKTYADMNGTAPEATGTKKHSHHHVPPVWSPFYNAEQGTLPDTSNWRTLHSARNLVVSLAPGADWSRYSKVQPGLARYTGTEIDLTPKQIATVADFLQSQMEKKLPRARLGTPSTATGTLQVDVNLTDAIVNDPSGIPGLAVSMAPAREWRSQVVAWVWDAQSHQPVACIRLIAADDAYEVVWGLRPTGRLRAALRAQTDLLADTLEHIQHKLSTTPAN